MQRLEELIDIRESSRAVCERLVLIGKVHVDVEPVAGNATGPKSVRCRVQLRKHNMGFIAALAKI